MSIRFPLPLKPGDLIAITAPSMGVPSALHARLDLAIANLKAKGFRVVEGECLRAAYKNKSADKILRAKELSALLFDPEIKAIMPPWGGELAMELLELIDFNGLADVRPKWFSGFSDLSTLHAPLTTVSGWATLHGPNLMELGARVLDATTQNIWSVLEGERGTRLKQYSSPAFQTQGHNWRERADAGFNLTEKTHWKKLDGSTSPLTFSGRLIGGCFETISRLAGTRFFDLEQFYADHRSEGIILYFESSELRPCELTRALLSVRMHGWFDNVNAVLIGRSATPEVNEPDKLNSHDVLLSALGDLKVPVIYDVDIGHVPPQLSLVNGAMAYVEYKDNGGIISQQL